MSPALQSGHAGDIARRFGLGEAATMAGPVARGRQGQVWHLTSDRGAFAIKERFAEADPVDPRVAEEDTAFQEAVLTLGASLPRPVRTIDGRATTQIDGMTLRAHEWVDVEAPDRRLDPVELGEVLARVHRAIPREADSVSGEAIDAWYSRPVGADRWWEVVAELRGHGAEFAEDLAQVVPDLVRAESLIEPPRSLRMCHRDLWADNVLRSRENGGIVVLDWENSGPADPSYELMAVLFEFGCGEAERVGRIYASYAGAGGPGRIGAPADASMLIAVLGHLTELACRRWLGATTDDEREDYEAWAREGIDDPVTVESVRAILDACVRG